jgi:hypothetical protein
MSRLAGRMLVAAGGAAGGLTYAQGFRPPAFLEHVARLRARGVPRRLG